MSEPNKARIKQLRDHSCGLALALAAATPEEIEHAIRPLVNVRDVDAATATVYTLVADAMMAAHGLAEHRKRMN